MHPSKKKAPPKPNNNINSLDETGVKILAFYVSHHLVYRKSRQTIFSAEQAGNKIVNDG